MRKIFAGAAAAAAAGIVALGLAAAPAQASATTQGSAAGLRACAALNIILTDFHVVDTAFTGGVGDGLFQLRDLHITRTDTRRASPLLQEAARVVINANLFDRLDNASAPSKARDRFVSRNDIRAFLPEACQEKAAG